MTGAGQTLPPEGGAGTLAVGATRECTWSVTVEGSWISLRSGENGQGDGNVEFMAAANPDPVTRRGALVLNGQRAEVAQGAAQCVITLGQTSASFSPTGGNGRVDVNASSALCSWTVSSDQSWINIRSGPDGKGSGAVQFEVEPTSGPPRTGTLTIGGQRFSVTQSQGCTYAITPAEASAGAEGGNGRVAIATAAACPWTASSNVPWLTFSPDAGSGAASILFNVQPTSGPARTGTAVVAGQAFTVTQAPGCTYQVQPLRHSVGAAGGTGTVTVDTAAGCAWSAASESSWLTLQGAAGGTGSGAVTFSAAASTGPSRSGTLTVAGLRVTVDQGQGCTFSISPTQESVAAGGGAGRVNVTAGSGCAWSASSSASWITITGGATGSGNGSVSYSVASTTGPSRSATLQVAGQTFTVNQGQGCTFTLNPSQGNVPQAGGTASFEIQTAASCAWTAATSDTWISITSPRNGSGTATVNLTAAGNTGPSRTGTVTAGGRTYTLTQGTGCSYALAPQSDTAPAAGGSGTFSVTAESGCAWSATSDAAWLTITGSASGTGNGSVAWSAAANAGAARSGTLTVNGRTFTVNQAGGCTFTVAPDTLTPAAQGGTSRVDVNTSSECGWTVSNSTSWITVAGSGTGTGPGAVELSFAANTGAPRTATLTVAGRTVTVNQGGGCTYTVNPETVTSPAAGGASRIDVTTAAECAWTAGNPSPWITITGGGSGTGPGAADISVAANTGPARSGSVTVAGRTVTVNQESGCTFTVNPTSATVPTAGGNGSISVTASTGCAWTAVSNVPWITVTSGASGNGDGVVQGTVEANGTGAPRTGTLTVAGTTVTVNQP